MPNLVVVDHAGTVLDCGGGLLRAVTEREAQTPEAIRMREIRRSFAERHPELYAPAPFRARAPLTPEALAEMIRISAPERIVAV